MEHAQIQHPDSERANASCPSGLCSVGLLKSLCPSCMLIGLVMLPFEVVARALRRLISGRPAGDGEHPSHAER